MNLSHLLTALLAGVVVFFVSEAQSSPHLQAPMLSSLALQAGLKCGLVNGQLVCDGTDSGNKNSKNDDDDDDDNNGDHHKGGKKHHNDDASGLSDCTIQEQGGGGGCTGGFKRVCEKMKSGKKCCGCVPDKSAKDNGKPKGDQGSTGTNTTTTPAGTPKCDVLWGDYCNTPKP